MFSKLNALICNKKNERILLIIIGAFFFYYTLCVFHKHKRMEDNKALAVAIITEATNSYVKYKFYANGKIFNGEYHSRSSEPKMRHKKKLVVYNILNPKENLVLIDYTLSAKYSLKDDLNTEINKKDVDVPIWRLGYNFFEKG